MVSLTLKQIEELALMLPVEQRQELIVRLSRSLAANQSSTDAAHDRTSAGTPKDLHGDWRDRFPDNFDVDFA